MAAAPVAVVYDDATKEIIMIVIPDRTGELADPAFNPRGSAQFRLSRSAYVACENRDDFMTLLPPALRFSDEAPKPPTTTKK